MDLINVALSPSNIVLTTLLFISLTYWLIVMFGLLEMDSVDIDMDLDADIDVDVDIDADVDVDADIDADVDAEADSDVDAGGGEVAWFFNLLRFFNFGKVPFMIVLSILILSMWGISMSINHPGSWLNPGNSVLISLIYIIPNLIVSAFLMKFLTNPLVPVFTKLNTAQKPLEFEGKIGILTTDIDLNGSGQGKFYINDSSVTISVRSENGKPIPKGQKVLIVQELPKEKYYLVAIADEDFH